VTRCALLSPECNIAIRDLNQEGRFLVYLTSPGETDPRIVKAFGLGVDGTPLRREVKAIELLSGVLPTPLQAPRILHSDARLVCYEALQGRLRPPSWQLPTNVSRAMGAFAKQDEATFRAHGDFAPWNVIEGKDGTFFLLDWENFKPAAPPYFDLAHWFVQAHTLLGHPTLKQLLRGVTTGEGAVGRALRAYSVGAGLKERDFVPHFVEYLAQTTNPMKRVLGHEVVARRRRIRLRERLENP
jgi:hypothetical protein